MRHRTGRDPLGERQVPAESSDGVQTLRAVENFPISGLRMPADLPKTAVATGRSIRDLVLERRLLPTVQLDEVLSAEAMTRPGVRGRRDVG